MINHIDAMAAQEHAQDTAYAASRLDTSCGRLVTYTCSRGPLLVADRTKVVPLVTDRRANVIPGYDRKCGADNAWAAYRIGG